jgi:hypothetical protein
MFIREFMSTQENDTNPTPAEPAESQPAQEKRRSWLRRARPGPSDSEPRAGPRTATPDAPPRLELNLFADLDTVGAENYIRYGAGGPRRYVTTPVEHAIVTPDHVLISLEITRPDDALLFKAQQISLQRTGHAPQQRTIWSVQLPDYHVQMTWVWDFFRMLSFLRLRVEMLPDGTEGTPEWRALYQALQQLALRDQVVIRVESRSGQVLQCYTVDTLPQPL